MVVPQGLWAASCSVWPPSWAKELFSLSRRNVPFSKLCWFLPVLLLCASKKSQVMTFLFTPTWKLNRVMRSVWLLPCPQTTSLTWWLFMCHVSQSLHNLGSPLLAVPTVPSSAFYWWAQNQTHQSRCWKVEWVEVTYPSLLSCQQSLILG